MKPTHPPRPKIKLNRSAVSELLNLLNRSQTQLARMCGLSPGYLSLLMAGKRSPSPDARRRIQEALGGERLRPAVHRRAAGGQRRQT